MTAVAPRRGHGRRLPRRAGRYLLARATLRPRRITVLVVWLLLLFNAPVNRVMNAGVNDIPRSVRLWATLGDGIAILIVGIPLAIMLTRAWLKGRKARGSRA